MTVAVGIDLGTTYSVVAWVGPDGVAAVIPDQDGQTLTPSVVSFAGAGTTGTGPVVGPVVGTAAKADQAVGEPDVAAFFKSSMGDPAFTRRFGGRDWTAAGLSGLVLAHLKEQASRALGVPVTKAVITVPEYFTHPQRTATIEAGRAAGLEVLRIISEPTAAALAYQLPAGQQTRRLVVYDLGGGTFDVSVVTLTADELTVIAATGDHQLGGRDWDDRLAMHLRDQFLADTGVDLLGDEAGELLVTVEQLKRALTARRSADVRVGAGGQSAMFTVARADFEEMTADLLQRTAQLTEQALSDAGLTWADVDGVLPVGGSTRMPMVRQWIERMSGRPPAGGIHPDQAVALGAALQAAQLASAPEAAGAAGAARPQPTGIRQVSDVVAHSLGMIAQAPDRSRYLNSVLLRRNSTIPCQAPRPYHFDVAGNVLEVFLTQGETDDPAECTYLGRYLVSGFPAAVTGTAVIDITYTYDENAVVSVAAMERSTGTVLGVQVDTLPDDVPARFLDPPPVLAVREPVTVYLAFDLSGSMSGEPLAAAKRAAAAFVSQVDLTVTSVGLIEFSDRVHISLRACQNAAVIDRAINALAIGHTGGGNLGQPFDEIHGLLHKNKGLRYALVLADGVWSRQPHAVQQARQCHATGIEVIAIGFGHADRKFLDQIASSTQNAFFTSVTGLSRTFSTIARELTEGTGRRGIRAR
jgi:molecular chaperone DnaK (HSP70)